MRGVVTALLSAVPGMASIAALLGLLVYVAAVMATQLFGDGVPDRFGDLGSSLFTLFQVMTTDDWANVAREAMAVQPLGSSARYARYAQRSPSCGRDPDLAQPAYRATRPDTPDKATRYTGKANR